MLPPEVNTDVISADLLRQLNRIAARTAPWPWAGPTSSMARAASMG